MKKIVGFVLMLILSLFIILMVINNVDTYDKITIINIFTAEENTSTAEEFLLTEIPYEIIEIHIEGYHLVVEDTVLSMNVLGEGSLVLVANTTNIGDIVEITFSYETVNAEYTGIFVETLPLIIIIIVIGGLGVFIIKKH